MNGIAASKTPGQSGQMRITQTMRLGIGALAMAACTVVFAQGSYPAKAIRVVVPSATGGAFDIITRAFAPQMSAVLGQPMVVENRATAGGIGGVDYVAKASPDGYTLLTAGVSQIVYNKHFYARLPYDPERDFAPIGMVGDLPFALFVQSTLPFRNVQEFIGYAKANPGKLNYGSAGVGQTFHLAMEMLRSRTGAELTHIPYKGTGPALQDLYGGRLEVMFYPPSGQLLNMVREGKLRVIGAVAKKRLPVLPDVPTFEESGIANFDVAGWVAMFSPANTPREIVSRLNRDLVKVLGMPEVMKTYEQLSMVPAQSAPEELGSRVSREIAMWGPLVKKLNIQLE
jgi:tripartite-type tricarboxylate transporter receptor subunit TctC